MVDKKPHWTVVGRADEEDGFHLIISGGRWIIGCVIVSLLIFYWSTRPGPGAFLPMVVAPAVIAVGIVVGLQMCLIGGIKYAHEVRKSP